MKNYNKRKLNLYSKKINIKKIQKIKKCHLKT